METININPKHIKIKDFDYNLPQSAIAKYPLTDRDSSKLLFYDRGEITEKCFSDIVNLISPESLVVFNNTKVVQARLIFKKATGARIEIFCLEPYIPSDYAQSFTQTKSCQWSCLVGNSKKWKDGSLFSDIEINNQLVQIKVTRNNTNQTNAENIIIFSWNNDNITFADILSNLGQLPIPPYLNRDTEESDLDNYQTVYSKIEGSVAAPTAGLHFTPKVIDDLKSKNIKVKELTLHVGAGTFKPVSTDEIKSHLMHAEFVTYTKDLIQTILLQKQKSKQVIAVGTTSVRSLESLYYIGYQLTNNPNFPKGYNFKVSQWLPYEDNEAYSKVSLEKSLQSILSFMTKHNIDRLNAYTEIMIVPSFDFKIVDGIITNFHQPQSTLLLLVSAFVGMENRINIYDYALKHNFRFLSYGDSSLLLR